MTRDQELIRKLLLKIEKFGVEGARSEQIEVVGYDWDVVGGHLNMLADAGFVVGEFSRSSTNPNRIIRTVHIFDLTWQGHEYLDLVRDEKIWRKTKELSNKVGATSLEMLMGIAKAVATDFLRKQGLPI